MSPPVLFGGFSLGSQEHEVSRGPHPSGPCGTHFRRLESPSLPFGDAAKERHPVNELGLREFWELRSLIYI